MRVSEVHRAINRLAKDGNVTGAPVVSIEDEDQIKPMALPTAPKIVPSNVTGKNRVVQILLKNQINIDRAELSSPLVNALARLAAFQNPEFYKAQSMRVSTYGKPRVICLTEVTSDHVILPRGLLEDAIAMLRGNEFRAQINDERTTGQTIQADFLGCLHERQKEALEAITAHDIGIISAPTAFGKTVVAASLIAERKANTLILVHRRQLMDQWRERLNTFLDAARGIYNS